MIDQQPQSLEGKLGELLAEANKINDKTIRDQVLAEIEKLRKEKTQKNEPQQRNTPKREVRTLTTAPKDLTLNYMYLGIERLTSDVYSTDEKPPSIFQGLYGDWSILSRNDTYYYGSATEYIQASLNKRIEKIARKKDADLVIVNFTRKRPFKFHIYKCSGLGRTNFLGEINAKFYKSK